MLYAKLRTARIYHEEVTYYTNALRQAKAADPLTATGLRHRNKIPDITAKLNAAKTAFEDVKQTVFNDEKFQEMSCYLKDACIAYYIDHRTEDYANSTYNSSSFLRDVRNFCHKI